MQDWSKLQQQLQSLADSQAALAKEVAALKQAVPLSSIGASLSSSAPASTSSSSAANVPVSNSPTGAGGQAAGYALGLDALSPATGAVGPQAAERTQPAGDLGSQLHALTVEVRHACSCHKMLLVVHLDFSQSDPDATTGSVPQNNFQCGHVTN